MLNNLYSKVDFLRKGMEGLWARNQVIADNIANGDTEGYKAKDINFEEIMSRCIEDENRVARNPVYLSEVKYAINEKRGLAVKANGNNVDRDKEMASLAENTMKYDLVSQAMNFQLRMLKEAINEGKR